MIQRKPWKLLLALVAVLAVGLFVPLTAQAGLENGTFTDPFNTEGQTFNVTDPDTQEVWLAGESWGHTTEGAEGFAEKSGGGNDILLQGFELPETCIAEGWKVKVRFDYKNPSESVNGNVKVYGFTNPDSGSWNSSTGVVGGDYLELLNDSNLTDTVEEGVTEWAPYQNSVTLTSTQTGIKFLAIGFDLPAPVAEDSSAVDNVELVLVAPVSMKFTPRTLNLKSKGTWVNVAISNPPECLSLTDIDTESLLLARAGNDGFPPDWSKVLKKKVMAKFSREELIGMFPGITEPTIANVVVSGTFNNGIAFEGVTTVKVINSGKAKKSKSAKPVKASQSFSR